MLETCFNAVHFSKTSILIFSQLQTRDMELLPKNGGSQLVFLSCSSTSPRRLKSLTRMTFLCTGALAMFSSSGWLTPLPMPSTTTFASLFSLSASVYICGLNDKHPYSIWNISTRVEARTRSYVIYKLHIKIVLEVQQEHYRVKSQLVHKISWHGKYHIY